MTSMMDIAQQCYEQGKFEAAIEAATEFLREQPNNITALSLCAKIYRQQGRDQQTAHYLTHILRVDQTLAWPYPELGRIFLRKCHFLQADALMRKAVERHPDNANIHHVMGLVLSEQNQLAAGEYHLRQALALDSETAEIPADLARNLTQQGRTEEAHAMYTTANKLSPDNVDIIAHQAKLYELCGDLMRADILLQEAEKISQQGVDLLRASFDARTGKTENALRILSRNDNISGDALLERGRLHESLKNYRLAWHDFELGNKRLRPQHYNRQGVDEFFARLQKFFVADTIARLPVADKRTDVPQPLFIVGSPRSGTTLIEQVLISHSAITPGGELPFLAELRELIEKLLPGDAFPLNLRQLFIGDKRHIASLMRDYYLSKAAESGLLKGPQQFFTDKMPFNEVYLPLLRMAFPAAPVLHITRHPLDVCVSMLANKLNHGFHCAYAIEDIVHHLLAVHTLHQCYRNQMTTGETCLRYETFVAEQVSETERIFTALGLPLERACIDFHKTRRYAPTPSYAKVGEKLNTASIKRYMPYIEQLRPFIAQLGTLLEAGNYTVDG